MDHLWQLDWNGEPEEEMLEAYTTLGFLAGHTSRITLLAWVTAVTYREPGLLAKAVTTLDVLSGGRAWLGIGAGFYEAETSGLGLPLPPAGERFERLEEALQICLQMWSGSDAPHEGRHYRLARTLNSPQPLTRPTSRPRSPASRTLHRWRCSHSASSRPPRNSEPVRGRPPGEQIPVPGGSSCHRGSHDRLGYGP
jgi:alkanesulfonate monooxygenase SsuD/methylene tetrahydromethanopterin reductase-like flavin-dependent oxidoreductase (luciferase family)